MTHLNKFSEPQSDCVQPPSWYQSPGIQDGPVIPSGIYEVWKNAVNDVLSE